MVAYAHTARAVCPGRLPASASLQGIEYTFLRAYGATESLPPEDADIIVDNAGACAALVAATRSRQVNWPACQTTHYASSPRPAPPPPRRGLAATGSTLKANNLEVFDTLQNSTTRLFASTQVRGREGSSPGRLLCGCVPIRASERLHLTPPTRPSHLSPAGLGGPRQARSH